MAQHICVRCKGCGDPIEIQDEYIPGIDDTALARLYQAFWQMTSHRLASPGGIGSVVRRVWQASLLCANPGCGQLHEYRAADLRLFDG